MSQVVVASPDSRIDGQHSRVTYYEESDIEAYYVTNEELAELCRMAAEDTISMSPDDLADVIDGIEDTETRNGRVFM